jgi:murein L,D-transpeptidase YcbB/YkuD
MTGSAYPIRNGVLLAGIGSLLVSSSAFAANLAEATTAPDNPDVQQPAGQTTSPELAQATCASWTDFTTGTGFAVRLPSTTRNGAQTNSVLGVGSSGDGVYKLQDALRRCYGQSIAHDGAFGAQTQQAVRNVQTFHGLPRDGVYGPQTRAAMTWPKYRESDGGYDHCW